MEDQSRSRRGAARRRFVAGTGFLTLAGVIAAGCTTIAAIEPKGGKAGDDAAVLNTVLGLEYGAAAAYEVALAAGALGAGDAAMARAFQADHARHAEALVGAIVRVKGKPVAARLPAEYGFSAAALSDRGDVLRFLVGFEQGLALAHLGAVPAFADKELAKGAAGILGIESMHWSALRSALGETPVPAPFLG